MVIASASKEEGENMEGGPHWEEYIAMAPKGKVKRRAPVGFNQVEGKQEDGIQ